MNSMLQSISYVNNIQHLYLPFRFKNESGRESRICMKKSYSSKNNEHIRKIALIENKTMLINEGHSYLVKQKSSRKIKVIGNVVASSREAAVIQRITRKLYFLIFSNSIANLQIP